MVDSERVYTEVTNEILARYGKTMTWDIKAGLMGKPEREAAEHLLSFFPDISLTIDDYLRERNVEQDRRWPLVKPLPGIVKLVQHLQAHKIPIAIATGSKRRNMEMKTSHLTEVFGCFGDKIVCADDGKIPPGRGKPCPDIFLVAATALLGRPVGTGEQEEAELKEKLERAKGLVFEDAIPGVQAGKRAGMNVVWVPDANLLDVEYSGLYRADETIKSVEDFVPEKWGLPPYETD